MDMVLGVPLTLILCELRHLKPWWVRCNRYWRIIRIRKKFLKWIRFSFVSLFLHVFDDVIHVLNFLDYIMLWVLDMIDHVCIKYMVSRGRYTTTTNILVGWRSENVRRDDRCDGDLRGDDWSWPTDCGSMRKRRIDEISGIVERDGRLGNRDMWASRRGWHRSMLENRRDRVG